MTRLVDGQPVNRPSRSINPKSEGLINHDCPVTDEIRFIEQINDDDDDDETGGGGGGAGKLDVACMSCVVTTDSRKRRRDCLERYRVKHEWIVVSTTRGRPARVVM